MKNQYVLESHEESERLERQSRMKAFDFKEELCHLKIQRGQRVLDAGCGSGIVSEYLSKCAPDTNVIGWDFSADRVEAAKTKYGSKNLRFEQRNLLQLEAAGGIRFDTVLCRYVLRHFSSQDTQKVISNLSQQLKPGGTFCCIDVEGILGDLYPTSIFLKKSLIRLREAKSVNFLVARKLPRLLIEQGFQNVDWRVITSEFKGENLLQEVDNLRQAIQHAAPFFKKVLGGASHFSRFEKEYFSALQEPGCMLFYNRIVAPGTKPKLAPKLVN